MKTMTTAALAAFALFAAATAAAQATGPMPAAPAAPAAPTAPAAPAACVEEAGVAPVVDPNAKPKVIKPAVEAFLAWQTKRRAELQCRLDAIRVREAAINSDHATLQKDIAALNAKSEDERRKPEAFAQAETLKQRDREIVARNDILKADVAVLAGENTKFKAAQEAYVAAVAAIDAKYAPKKKPEQPPVNTPAPKPY